MPINKIGANLLTILILLFLFMWIYAKNKGMTLVEVIKEIVSATKGDEDG